MIVRDEAEMLPACLRAAAPIASQVIVVDTGSADDTVQIARSHGALVVEVAWENDFAAARNESLRHARCPWIMILDADEIVHPQSDPRLSELLRDPGVAGIKVVIENLNADGPSQLFTPVRLFRNKPSIRFQGAVHEEVWPSLSRFAVQSRMRVEQSALRVVHYGYLPERVAAKGERNLELLRRELAREPRNLYLRMKEYEELRKLGRLAQCDDKISEAFELARSMPEDDFSSFALAPLLVANYALMRIEGGHPRAGLEAAEWGLDLFRGEPWLLYARALAALRLGDLRSSVGLFRACLDLNIAPKEYYVEPGIASWLSSYHLAQALFGLGEPGAALEELRGALEANPNFTDALRLAVELNLQLGDPAAAMAACMQILKMDEADLWSLVNGARIMLALGMLDKARKWLLRALASEPDLEEAKALLAETERGTESDG